MFKQMELLLIKTWQKLYIVYTSDWKRIRFEKCENQHNFYISYINDTFGIWSETENDL